MVNGGTGETGLLAVSRVVTVQNHVTDRAITLRPPMVDHHVKVKHLRGERAAYNLVLVGYFLIMFGASNNKLNKSDSVIDALYCFKPFPVLK